MKESDLKNSKLLIKHQKDLGVNVEADKKKFSEMFTQSEIDDLFTYVDDWEDEDEGDDWVGRILDSEDDDGFINEGSAYGE